MSSILNDSTNTLSKEMENAMMEDWNDFLPPSRIKAKNHSNNNPSPFYGAFQGASNCTFNINVYSNGIDIQSPVKKRRRIIIDDEFEEWNCSLDWFLFSYYLIEVVTVICIIYLKLTVRSFPYYLIKVVCFSLFFNWNDFQFELNAYLRSLFCLLIMHMLHHWDLFFTWKMLRNFI